jgi:hypothetical protein
MARKRRGISSRVRLTIGSSDVAQVLEFKDLPKRKREAEIWRQRQLKGIAALCYSQAYTCSDIFQRLGMSRQLRDELSQPVDTDVSSLGFDANGEGSNTQSGANEDLDISHEGGEHLEFVSLAEEVERISGNNM